MPEVSIIIPVYNNEKYIEKCIHSVLNQTFGELEIIAVNDGSTDESGKILKNLEREDVRIFVAGKGGRLYATYQIDDRLCVGPAK